MLTTRIYLIVAALVAAAAFGIAQISPGSGMLFVAAAIPCWISYSLIRGRRRNEGA